MTCDIFHRAEYVWLAKDKLNNFVNGMDIGFQVNFSILLLIPSRQAALLSLSILRISSTLDSVIRILFISERIRLSNSGVSIFVSLIVDTEEKKLFDSSAFS